MYPKDIARVYEGASVGTSVRIVNQPYKVGIALGRVYLEVHPHLDEDRDLFSEQYAHVAKLILTRVDDHKVNLFWPQIRQAVEQKTGIPLAVGTLNGKRGS